METFNDLVSIIMPVHNGVRTISESIDSVLRQTYKRWELIIVDDASTDETETILANYKDPRIQCLRLSQNGGTAQARNKGITTAKGRFLAFLDSDDLWLPDKLMHQLDFMKRHQYGFTYTEYRHFSDDPAKAGDLVKIQDFVDYAALLKGNDIGCLTVMLDRMSFPSITMPQEHHEDYITWLNLLRTGKRAYGLHEDLARYRKSAQSLTGNKWKSLKWTWEVYRNSQNLSRSQAWKNMCYYIVKGVRKHYDLRKREKQ